MKLSKGEKKMVRRSAVNLIRRGVRMSARRIAKPSRHMSGLQHTRPLLGADKASRGPARQIPKIGYGPEWTLKDGKLVRS